ncbi:MAG: sigma-70 family RNA polymerase sigma factor [Candidatus Omnitrophica bacterium]|nr:sigma-70 family RNA polymerase sigma factor [Candidatus Omnitrophota bacterium]
MTQLEGLRMFSREISRDSALNEEQDLIRAAQRGNHKAFARLVVSVEERLFRMVYRFFGREQEARDTLQEVFLKAYQGLPKFNLRSSFYTWIYRIAIRTCSRRVTSASLRMERSSESFDTPLREDLAERVRREFISKQKSAREVAQDIERTSSVWKAVRNLPQKFFEVVILHDLEELSLEEVASILKIPKGTVMSRLNRAHHKLVQKLKEEGISR